MVLHREVWRSNSRNAYYADYGKKKELQEIFKMVYGISSNMDFIGRIGVAQTDVYSHKVVKFSAIESSM